MVEASLELDRLKLAFALPPKKYESGLMLNVELQVRLTKYFKPFSRLQLSIQNLIRIKDDSWEYLIKLNLWKLI